MKYIELTNYYYDKPIIIFIEKITSFGSTEDGSGTIINLSGNHIIVKENYKEVLEEIKFKYDL